MATVADDSRLRTGQASPDYPSSVTTLVSVLRWQMEHMPGRIVCHRIVRGRRQLGSEPLSIEQLAERAAAVAALLRERNVEAGDRVILSLADPHDFLVAFFGCLSAGAAAVPLPTPGESGAPRAFAARVRGVCSDCDPSLAIVEDAARFRAAAADAAGSLAVLEARSLLELAPATKCEPSSSEPDAGAAAFLQYTSGSTGSPKGVVVTHANILANCRAIRDATAYTRGDRMVSWLPLHHDMGLIGGLLTSIYCAAETWPMPPMEFLARPVTWLQAIGAFGATLTVAPTFAYALCARKLPDRQLSGVDLSCLRLAYIGAEPIAPAVVENFVARFAAYGLSPAALYPVYGLAEATLAVSFPPPGRAIHYDVVDRQAIAGDGIARSVEASHSQAMRLVSVGRPLPRHEVEIVSTATGRTAGEREVGELLVRGPSVTPRYFGEGTGVSRDVLKTGDLAYIAAGEIYIVDRIKDLVILSGRNHAPSDIEAVVAEVDGVRRGRIVAFGTDDGHGGQLHVVAEARPGSWRSPDEIRIEVSRRLRAQIGISAATVTVVRPGSLERTSSGKIKRRACAQAFEAGTLQVVQTRSDLDDGVYARVSGTLTTVLRGLGRRF